MMMMMTRLIKRIKNNEILDDHEDITAEKLCGDEMSYKMPSFNPLVIIN